MVALAAMLVVVGVGGWKAWQWQQNRQTAAIAQDYLKALDGAAGPPGDGRTATVQDLARLGRDAPAGYRTLARLREASLQADTGNLAAAETLWNQVANDGAADRLLRDAAVLQLVLHQIDSGDPAALAARLKPLTAPDNPWRPMAEEAQALLDLRQGRNDAARDTFRRLSQDVTAPDGVRGRANGLLTRLGG
jgi:hypothetical protein